MAVSLVVLVAFLAAPMLVRAVEYNVGVKVGDWMKYGRFTVTWSGNGTEPSYVTDAKTVDWEKIEVESISGTTVSLNMTIHFNNGTQVSQSNDVDVKSNPMALSSHLIASNLTTGDPISAQPVYPPGSQSGAATVNETVTGRYAGASRNVNVYNSTGDYIGYAAEMRLYWDQSTGVMVEMYLREPDTSSPGAYAEFSLKATETNMWSPDLLGTLSNNLIYIIAGIIIMIAVIAAAIVLRRKKPSPPPPPPPAQTTKTSTKDTKQERDSLYIVFVSIILLILSSI